MPTTTGTAAGHLVFMTAMRDFLKLQSWTVIGGPNTGTLVGTDELFMQAPGVSGQQPKVGFKPVTNGSTYWNFAVVGLTTFNAGLLLIDQVNRSDFEYLLASNTTITYRINANATACWGWYRVGTVYQLFVFGFLLPQHLPAAWPYPLLIGASSRTETLAVSDQSWSNAAFFDTYEGIRFCRPNGVWTRIANRDPNGNTSTPQGVSPWHRYFDNVEVIAASLTGSKPPSRSLVMANVDGGVTCGHIPGVFHVTGQGTVAEATITVGTITYECIPNVFRTGLGDWCAMEIG